MEVHSKPAGSADAGFDKERVTEFPEPDNPESSKESRPRDPSGQKRVVRSVSGGGQIELFPTERRTPGKRVREGRVCFIDQDPREIFIGTTRLDEYLSSAELGWVLDVRDLLREIDWSEFEARYCLSGRSPYAPVTMMGLVLYGTMSGASSLRALEKLARKDLGAMWLTGGVCPDHASLGRFIDRHGESLTDSFFEELTRRVLGRLGSQTKQLAGDGTIVEAAASRYQTIKREAAQLAAEKATERAKESPDDEELKHQAERTKEVADAIDARAKARRSSGSDAKKTQGTKTEPEAPILKTKQGLFRPAYTSSAMANEDRIIVAQHVEQTNEQASVAPMLDQASRVADDVETVLFDGNYAKGPVLEEAVKRDLDILTKPSGSDEASKARKQDGASEKTKQNAKITKQDFIYDEEHDQYVCPEGQTLKPGSRRVDKRRGTFYREFCAATAVCQACASRALCFTGKTLRRRRVRRYDTDELMEAQRKVMAQPNARALLARRGSWVEPVFSELKGVQGLSRFKRFGLRGVRIEFAIHACAYNLRRLVAAVFALYFLVLAAIRPSCSRSRRAWRSHLSESVMAEIAL